MLAQNYVLTSISPPPGSKIKATAAMLDARLHVSDCPDGITTSSSSKNTMSANIIVLIQCKSENWRVYVPVRLQLTVPAVTAATPLTRGQIIGQNDVSINMVDSLRFRQQGYTKIDQVVGAKVKRNVSVGNIISNNDICIVCRSESVVIKAQKNGMVITTQGTALSDGALGEQIRVKNNKSKRIIDAEVTGVGEVGVSF